MKTRSAGSSELCFGRTSTASIRNTNTQDDRNRHGNLNSKAPLQKRLGNWNSTTVSRLLRNNRRIQKKKNEKKRSWTSTLSTDLRLLFLAYYSTTSRIRTSDKTTPGPNGNLIQFTSWCDGKDMEGEKNQSKRIRFLRAFRYGGPAGRPARPLRRSRRPVGYWCCYVMSCQPLGDAPAEPFPHCCCCCSS